MASLGSGVRGTIAQNYMKLFVAHKMTRNTTMNKIDVAATELPQLLHVALVAENMNAFMFG